MKKRLLALLLATVLGCTMMAGCGNVQQEAEENLFPETKADDGIVNLTVWTDADGMDLMNEFIKDFKAANAGTTFEFKLVEQGEGECKNVLLGDIKNAGDVFSFADDQLNSLIAGGALSKVPNASEVKDANTAESVAASSYNGELYAYPMTADNGYFLYYDKKYFDDDDVRRLEGILDVCEANGKKMTFDLLSGWYMYAFFGQAGLTMGLNEDGVTNHCDWNGRGLVAGADIAQAMLDLVARPGFKVGGDADLLAGAKDGSVIAGVSGVWNAVAIKEIWGDDYGAVKLPTYDVKGHHVQMASFTGFKMVGVNPYSEEEEWAHKFADYITNEAAQTRRFVVRNQGPSNRKAAASDEVAKVPAILAVIEQSSFGTLQRVGNSYWGACTTFAETIAAGNPGGKSMQDLVDALVEGITQSVAQ